MIGANGAGKTTLLHAISGLLKKSGGEIEFLGQSIMKKNARDIVKAGITQVPEGRRIFSRHERCGKPLDGRVSAQG